MFSSLVFSEKVSFVAGTEKSANIPECVKDKKGQGG